MKSRTTLILLGVVVAVALWIKFDESKRPNTEEAKRLAGNMLNFEPANLEGLLVQNGDDRIELRRVNEKWRLENPFKDQADRAALETLVSDLESWPREETIPAREIDADKSKLAEFDLAKPKLRLKLLGKNLPPEIWFGKDAALEGRMYVRFENSKETYIVRQKVRNEIAKKAEDFRDRKLTDLSAGQITRVVLKTPAGEMELQKQGENWEIIKPLRARGDAQKIGDLIALVTGARIAQFVADDRGDLQPYGLAQPRGAITLFTADDKEGQMLQIGDEPEKDKEQTYVRFMPRNSVYSLPKNIGAVLETKPADLRDKHLARIDSNNLDRLTIESAGKNKIVLARKDQSWSIASQNNQPANATEVSRLIEAVKKEQVARFVEDVASDLPKYGLDQPQLRLIFSSFASENTAESKAGEQPFATIAFGKTEGDVVFARVSEEPFIVAVGKAFMNEIFIDPAQWQDLAIFKFKPEQVHRLSVSTESEASFVRGEKNEWARANGSEAIDQTNLQSLLNTLTNLRAVRWNGRELPPQSFDKVQATISFTTSADDKEMHKLVVGGPAGGGMWYGRVEGRDGVFVLSNPDFNALRLPLTAAARPTPSPSPSASTANSAQ